MRVTWLDRAIAKVSPQTAMRRVRARAAFDVASRAYSGAARDRNKAGWTSTNASADAEIAVGGRLLRSRMRDLVRNNPHATRAVAVWEAALVGDGIEPRIKDARVKEAWARWAKVCDADGQLPFIGLEALAAREMVEAGEVLIRRRWRRRTDRIPGNMQIQVLEADHLDTDKIGETPAGGVIVNGVEFDKIGRRVAYWLFPEHPGSNATISRTSISSRRVPAEDVIHLYRKLRTQVRGVPWGHSVMTRLRDLDEYENAELIRKKIEACMVGVLVETGEDDVGIGIPIEGQEKVPPGVYDRDGVQVDRFEPGMFAVARGGKDIKFNQPAATGSYEAYRRASIHTIAAGFGLPFEVLSGDLSMVNYSSIRAGIVEWRRQVEQLQWQLLIPTLCDRVFAWFVEAHALDNALPADTPRAPDAWATPKFEWVDPLKDASAELLAMRSGIRSWDDVVASTGRDPDEVMEEIAARAKQFDALGLIFDSDPRQTAKNGALQIVINAGDGSGSSDSDRDPA